MQNALVVGAGTLCNDVAWPRSAARYHKGVDESRAKLPLTAGMPRGAMLCAAWPFTPKEPAVRITDRGPSNIMLVRNERDVATPLAGARELRRALGDRAVVSSMRFTVPSRHTIPLSAVGLRQPDRGMRYGAEGEAHP